MECTLEVGQRLHTEAAISDCMEWILARESSATDDALDSAALGDGVEYLDNMMESIASFILIREYMKRYNDDPEAIDPIEIMSQTHRRAVMTMSGPTPGQSWLELMSSTLYLLEKGDDFVFGEKFRSEIISGVGKRDGRISDAALARHIDNVETKSVEEFTSIFKMPR